MSSYVLIKVRCACSKRLAADYPRVASASVASSSLIFQSSLFYVPLFLFLRAFFVLFLLWWGCLYFCARSLLPALSRNGRGGAVRGFCVTGFLCWRDWSGGRGSRWIAAVVVHEENGGLLFGFVSVVAWCVRTLILYRVFFFFIYFFNAGFLSFGRYCFFCCSCSLQTLLGCSADYMRVFYYCKTKTSRPAAQQAVASRWQYDVDGSHLGHTHPSYFSPARHPPVQPWTAGVCLISREPRTPYG